MMVLLGTLWYCWVPQGTVGYLKVLVGMYWYFWVPKDNLGYLLVVLVT